MLDATLIWSDDAVEVRRTVVGPLTTNVYVITCRRTGDSTLIDPADDPDGLRAIATRHRVATVLATHGHADHVGALERLSSADRLAWMNDADAALVPSPTRHLSDGMEIAVGALRVTAHHTPGHTPGSTCLTVAGTPLLFAGDTLFPGGPGATHFPGGDFPTIIRSIEDRLLTLPDATIVWPGHGEPTTIGSERPRLAEWVARGW